MFGFASLFLESVYRVFKKEYLDTPSEKGNSENHATENTFFFVSYDYKVDV